MASNMVTAKRNITSGIRSRLSENPVARTSPTCDSTSDGASGSLKALHMLARETLPRELLACTRHEVPRRLDLRLVQEAVTLPAAWPCKLRGNNSTGLRIPSRPMFGTML